MTNDTTETTTPSAQPFTDALAKFSPSAAALQEMVANAAPILATKDATAEQFHAVRMPLKNARVAIEKTGKALRADAVAFQKAVIAEENRLVAIIEPTEKAIEERQRFIEQAAERKREEARQAALKRAMDWAARYAAVGETLGVADAQGLSDEALAARLEIATEAYARRRAAEAEEIARKAAAEAEARRAAEAEAEAKRQTEAAERARLQAALEEERQQRLAEQARADVERQRLAAERAEEDRVRREEAEKLRREVEEARAAQRKAEAEEHAARMQAAEAVKAMAPPAPRVADARPTIRLTEDDLWSVIERAKAALDSGEDDGANLAHTILMDALARREGSEAPRG